jgi:hypothetical protein
VVNVEQLLAGLPSHIARSLDRLEETLASGDIARSREELRAQMGAVSVEADARGIRLYSERGAVEATLLRAVGAHTRNCGSGGAT